MLSCLSTRSKPVSQDKLLPLARFFKKMSTDENERNCLNFPTCKPHHSSSKHLANLTDSKSKMGKTKKSQGSLQILKPLQKALQPSHHDKENNCLKKDKSTRNLKLATSVELPVLLTKSISQTTVNRKVDEGKLRMFDRAGFRKKIDTCLKDQQSQYHHPEPRHPETRHHESRHHPETRSKMRESKMKISQFRLGKKLGSGRFGNVFIAEEKETSSIYALKVMNKLKVKEADMEMQVLWEIKLQMYMSHPNILKLYGFFDDSKNIYLVLEYCSGCLFKEFRTKVRLSEEETAYYGKQTIAALKYMHNESIIHRDIKPENIMLEFGVLKMSDFGWSTYAPLYKRKTFCGTVDYVPPEIVEGNTYDERVDIWALGVLLYELVSGAAPFETKHEQVTYEKIVHSECKFPSHFSKALRETIMKILEKNPCRRPNLDQIESGAWFEKYKSTGRFISKEVWAAWNEL